MKDLILEVPILLGTLVFGIVYFLVLFQLAKNKRFALLLENIAEYLFLVIISGANFFPLDRLDPSDLGDPEKGFYSGLLLVVVYALFFILFRGTRKQLLHNFGFLFRQPVLGIYFGIIIFSVFWSENPEATLRATLGMLFLSLFAVHFARKYEWRDLSRLLRWNSSLIAVYSIFSALLIPSVGICEKGWCGGFGHPISLGNIMALGFTLWILNALFNAQYFWRSLAMSVLCLAVLQFTNSAGALLLLLLLLIILLTTLFLKKLSFAQALTFFILLLLLFGVVTIWLISNFNNFLYLFGKDLTFSGRMPLWTILLQTSIRERPWLGYGYNAYWQRWRGDDSPAAEVVNAIVGDGRDWVAHSHNGFLEIILNIGLIGLITLVILFVINIVKTIKLTIDTRRSETFMALIVLTYIFITNLYNPPIALFGYGWFLFLLITIRLNLVSEQASKFDSFNLNN